MSEPASSDSLEQSFISRSEYHRPRVRLSVILVLVGLPLFVWGLHMSHQILLDPSNSRAEARAAGWPMAVGGIMLGFGVYGLVTGIPAMSRSGDDAIDLALCDTGLTIRGGHLIPWWSIKYATAIQYINTSRIPVLWRSENLNRALVLRLREPLDVPGAGSEDGNPTVRIGLQRYPADEYEKLYTEVVAKLRSRRIQVLESKKHKQT